MKIIKLFLIALSLSLFVSGANANWELVTVGKIYEVENAWFGEGFAFKHTTAVDGCGASDNEYAVVKEHAGYDSIHAIVLTAIATQADTEMVIEKRGVCVFGSRTKVLAVRIKDGAESNNQSQ